MGFIHSSTKGRISTNVGIALSVTGLLVTAGIMSETGSVKDVSQSLPLHVHSVRSCDVINMNAWLRSVAVRLEGYEKGLEGERWEWSRINFWAC